MRSTPTVMRSTTLLTSVGARPRGIPRRPRCVLIQRINQAHIIQDFINQAYTLRVVDRLDNTSQGLF